MIVANLATFPPRANNLDLVIRSILPQVDLLNVVLNEYGSVPHSLRHERINAYVPDENLLDLGKFHPRLPPGARHVFTIDDDILYPPDYVRMSLSMMTADRMIHGYHGRLMHKSAPTTDPWWLLRRLDALRKGYDDYYNWPAYRTAFNDAARVRRDVNVLGSGVSFCAASDFPDYAFMKGAAGFADLRLANWAAEHGIGMCTLPKSKGWLKELDSPASLYQNVTRSMPAEMRAEIARLMERLA